MIERIWSDSVVANINESKDKFKCKCHEGCSNDLFCFILFYLRQFRSLSGVIFPEQQIESL